MMPLFDPSSVDPFKLRTDLATDSQKLFEIAERHFGQPSSISCRWEDKSRGPLNVQEWNSNSNQGQDLLELSHYLGESHLEIGWRGNWYDEPLGDISQAESFFIRIQSFLVEVSKPWSDWAEEEILENPSWIFLFSLAEGHSITDKMHSAMVMYSYLDPEDEYVKRYFKNLSQRRS